MVRIRIHYARTESLRYVGTLDMHKVWERFLRRAHLPVAYSQGFHPQPKIQQACPLPLGFLGEDEIIDIWLTLDQADVLDIAHALTTLEQPGIQIHEITQVATNDPAMMTQITAAEYRVIYLDNENHQWISTRIEHLLAEESLLREKRGKKYNLRPLITSLQLKSIQPVEFEMCLSAKEGATGRPEEVLTELGLDPLAARYIRTRLLVG